MRVSTVHCARGIFKRFKLSAQINRFLSIEIKRYMSIELKRPRNLEALRNIFVPDFGNKKHSSVKK